MAELEVYDKGTMDRVFMTRPELREEMRVHRFVEPYTEGVDYDFRVVPGDRRDVMALPACSIDGKYDEAWYIDLRLDTDSGAAYIGNTIFHHLANLVGYCQVEELRRAQAKVKELEVENANLARAIGRMRIVNAELDELVPVPTEIAPATSGRPAKNSGPTAA